MRILITGISGFIGQALAQRLTTQGHEVHGLYEHAESLSKNPTVNHDYQHIASLTSHGAIEQLIKRISPEVVLHMASRSEVAMSFRNYIPVTEVNYVATVNLAEACRRFAPDLKAFVMASTMETYGNACPITGESVFHEQTRQYPMAPYAVAKLACERYLAYMGYAYDFPHVILRQTNTYGRRDNSFFIVERIISQMLAGDVCNLGAGWPVRNFLYIDDLVDFYEVLISTLPIGHTFCTGPDNAMRIDALAALIAKKLDWQGAINWDTIPPRAAEVPWLNSTPAKARKLLGWSPKVSLADGLNQTIRIWRTAPDAQSSPSWPTT